MGIGKGVSAMLAGSILLCAVEASAFGIRFDPPGPLYSCCVTETVIVDIVLDIEDVTGLELLGVSVLYNPFDLTWLPALSTQPTYMLYSPATAAQRSVYMIPDPAFYVPFAGQVLISWRFARIQGPGTFVTGNGLVLATLAFHMTSVAKLALSIDTPGTIVRVNGLHVRSSVTLGPDLLVVPPIPEPATAVLIALGLLGLAGARSRRRG